MHKIHANLFKALGVESRLKILHLLKLKGPLCVNDLAETLGISPSAVSQHLKVLKNAGLVNDERQGYYIPYDVNVHALEDCGKVLIKVCSCRTCETKDTDVHSHESTEDKIKILKAYEAELRNELDDIQARIKELKKQV